MDPATIRLIAITDNIRDGKTGLLARAAAAAHGGATCIQLRLKDVPARDLVSVARELVRAVGVPVIVNDRADVAIAAGAAGVHLGPDDVPLRRSGGWRLLNSSSGHLSGLMAKSLDRRAPTM